ncbi:hypothetical protein [Paenibacillus sinopodophylli]|uniref:hypothetical protein n=1 Tax=Paenibacillus sinopodophylli TaxID=1837342 RepID=UPI00110D0501|nr:hypothetical protein [Paenibacillus sinopodophylli]
MQEAENCQLPADNQTLVTFRALVEAIVPHTPELAGFGELQTLGAADLGVHYYLAWELDHTLALFFGIHLTNFPLAASTARLLNVGAVQFAAASQLIQPINCSHWVISPFSALAPLDRIRVLAMLEQLRVDLGTLPPPYQNNGGNVKFIIDYLNRATLFGTYSEWSAYGSTRLCTPTERVLQSFPIGWEQSGYPGVSLGYRALRGFLLTIVRDKGVSTIV